jgi:hypothetical protein
LWKPTVPTLGLPPFHIKVSPVRSDISGLILTWLENLSSIWKIGIKKKHGITQSLISHRQTLIYWQLLQRHGSRALLFTSATIWVRAEQMFDRAGRTY